jgi:hypothetical protein
MHCKYVQSRWQSSSKFLKYSINHSMHFMDTNNFYSRHVFKGLLRAICSKTYTGSQAICALQFKIQCNKFIQGILCFVDRASLYNLVNKTNMVHNFSLHVLFLFSTCFGRYVLIIGRIICINATPGICHSVWMTIWYAGCDPSHPIHSIFHTPSISKPNKRILLHNKPTQIHICLPTSPQEGYGYSPDPEAMFF